MERHPARSTMVVAVGATVAVSLPVFLLGALFVDVSNDLHAPSWSLGVLVALFWSAAAGASGFAGILDERLGSRRLTLFSLGLAAAASTGFALSFGVWQALIAWTVIGGAASGIQHPATNTLIAFNVGVRRRGLAFGLKQSAVPFATLVAGLAIPFVALTFGWRWAFGAAAVIALAVQIGYLWAGRGDGPVHRAHRTLQRLPPGLGRTFACLIAVAIAGGATVTATTAYLVVAAVGRGIPQAEAGVILAAASAIGAVSRALLGAVVDRYRGASLSMASALVLSSGVAALVIGAGPTWLLVVGAVVGSGIAGAWSGLMHYFVARTAGPATPAATGRIQLGSFVGCAAGPVAFGAVAAAGSPAAPWLMLAAVGVVGGLLGFAVVRRAPSPWAG